MSEKEYTTELLKLEDAEIEKMEETEEEIILKIHLKRKLQTCPIIAHKPALCLMEVLLLRRQDATEKSFTFGEKKCNSHLRQMTCFLNI